MNKMKAWQGSYGVSQQEGIVSPAYFIFNINRVTGDYFHVAVRSKAYVPFFTQASDGVRIGQWDLSRTRMQEIPFLVPSFPEQNAIVRFLDHADRRIRRYIRAKREADYTAGGAEASHHPPGCHGPDRRPHRPALPDLQAVRRGVAGGRAGALGPATRFEMVLREKWIIVLKLARRNCYPCLTLPEWLPPSAHSWALKNVPQNRTRCLKRNRTLTMAQYTV